MDGQDIGASPETSMAKYIQCCMECLYTPACMQLFILGSFKMETPNSEHARGKV